MTFIWHGLFGAALCSLILIFNPSSGLGAPALEDLRAGLPVEHGKWQADPARDKIYDPENIFEYINGAAEVYLAYGMRACLTRVYTADEAPDLVLDIFHMSSPEDAFGVFTHDLSGEKLYVGEGGRYRYGWLSYWKGPYFVSIYSLEETPGTREVLEDLGELIAASIKAENGTPWIIDLLPPSGLDRDSIRYLYNHWVLNHHHYLADENILGLGRDTPSVLATYMRPEGKALLLKVSYPLSTVADLALESVVRHHLPETRPGIPMRLEDGKWAGVAVQDNILSFVLESDSEALALELLRECSLSR